MAETTDTTHEHRSVFDAPKKKRNPAVTAAIVGSIIVHAVLGYYLYKNKFEPKYREYTDDVTDVAIIKPAPPPPPPKLQPRPPVNVPADLPTIPPLPVPPVEKRIETPVPPKAAPPPPPRPSVITNPDWARRPSGEDIARYYPDRAMRMNTEGRATISCTVTAKGTLESCEVQAEEPADMGFGEAALRMSKLFRMRPKTQDGAPVEGGSVRIPIRFNLPKG